MSTLQEKVTSISKTSRNITNSFVKSEEASLVGAEAQKFNYDFCENFSEKEENFVKSRFSGSTIPQTHSRFQTFGDLSNAAKYLSVSKEELDESDDEDIFTTCEEKFIIDIKPTVLQQEQFEATENLPQRNSKTFDASSKTYLNTKRLISKKRISELLKSLYVLCDICDDKNTERVIKLNRQEKIVAAVILMKSSGVGIITKKIFPAKIPQQSCGRCFTKIILFYNRHRNRYAQNKIKKETGKVMDQSSHGYHCQCLPCRNQYGSLSVLLKGIEERDKMQSSESQVQFQSELNVGISQRQALVSFQQSPVNIAAGRNEEQFRIKYETERQPFQPQLQGLLHTSQSNIPLGYGQFQMEDSQMVPSFQTSTKIEICSSQIVEEYHEQRLNVGDQSQFGVNYQSHSQYYAPDPNVSDIQTFVGSSSCPTREEHLPTLLKELEDKCRKDIANQPSTSSGISDQTISQDEKQSKKILTCVHCSKTFSHKGDFNKHVRKHTKEKPYKCSFCDKMFSHTSNLHRHQRIHSGDRPFRCQYCDKCFNRKDKLDSHKNSKFCKNRRYWK